MKFLTKGLIGIALALTSVSSIHYLWTQKKTIKDTIKLSLIRPKLNKENDKKWAKEIINGGYLLFFRHAEREKWIDVQMYDAIESDLTSSTKGNLRKAENDYFDKAVCLNSRGKVQAKAMAEIVKHSSLPIGYVISSPSCRARQTSNYVFGGYDLLDRNLVHKGPYLEDMKKRNKYLKNLFLSLPIEEGKNTIISAHNSVVDCPIFSNRWCALSLEEGGFYVIKKTGNQLKLVHEFHNFNDFSKVFFPRNY